MTATLTQARDDIYGLFKTAWEADPSSSGVSVVYEDVASQPPSTGDANDQILPWARIQVQMTAGGQVSLAGETGTRRFGRVGIITVQVFTPSGDGMKQHDVLTEIARNAFEGKTTLSGALFRDARILALGQDGPWYVSSVLVNFEYDQIK